jgi:hypothetical protein
MLAHTCRVEIVSLEKSEQSMKQSVCAAILNPSLLLEESTTCIVRLRKHSDWQEHNERLVRTKRTRELGIIGVVIKIYLILVVDETLKVIVAWEEH